MKKQVKKPYIQKIIVTNHAIEQYKERVNDYPNDIVKAFLMEIVQNGSIIKTGSCKRTGTSFGTLLKICLEFKMVYKKIGIVVVYENGIATVVTCTGDEVMRNWYRNVEVKAHYAKASY